MTSGNNERARALIATKLVRIPKADRAEVASEVLGALGREFMLMPRSEKDAPAERYFTCKCRGQKHGALSGCSGTGGDFIDGVCAWCLAQCREIDEIAARAQTETVLPWLFPSRGNS